MKNFFIDEYPGIIFNMFGPVHLFLIAVTVIGFILIYLNRDKIHSLNKKTKDLVKDIVVFVMFINMLIYYIGMMYAGVYDWHTDLPLHLCFISGYIFMYALFFKDNRVYKMAYFLAFVGPIPAILWPDLIRIDGYTFIQFILSHHFFLLANMFIYYAYNLDVKFKDWFKTLILANIIFIIMIIFNTIFGTNYIMSNNFPETFLKIYPFMRNFDYPIILLEVAGIGASLIAYIPVYLRNREKKNNKCLQESRSLL